MIRASQPSATAQSQRVDVYDQRSLQTKALERWSSQRQAWDCMKSRLLLQTGRGRLSGGTVNNFAHACTASRARQEELNMMDAAVPLSALSSHYTWESMLRRQSDSEAVRYVPVGKTTFPYALYSEIKDPTSRKEDNEVYARVATEDSHELHGPLGLSGKARTGRRVTAAAEADECGGYMKGLLNTTTATGDASGSGATGSGVSKETAQRLMQQVPAHLRTTVAHYQSQLRAYAPFIERRFAHFSVPRDFLCVHGHAVPLSTWNVSGMEGAESHGPLGTHKNEEIEPVMYYPHPPPQQQRFSVPSLGRPRTAEPRPTSSGTSTTVSFSRATTGGRPVSVHLSSAAEVFPRGSTETAPLERAASDIGIAAAGNAEEAMLRLPGEDAEAEGQGTAAAPSLELSTLHMLLHSEPGGLAHENLAVRNTGSVTVYYSWVTVDLVGEDLEEVPAMRVAMADSGVIRHPDVGKAENASEESSSSHLHCTTDHKCSGTTGATDDSDSCDDGNAWHRRIGRDLHGLATNAAASRHYVRLSRPTSGVLLPGDDEIFPFSVRAPYAGRFRHTFELLTIPPSPTRILIDLTAVVKARGPSAMALSRRVAEALTSRADRTARRQLVRSLVRDDTDLDAADLHAAVDALRFPNRDAQAAEERRRTEQRLAWRRNNAMTYDGVPYNRAVFDGLERVWTNTIHALQVLTAGSETAEMDHAVDDGAPAANTQDSEPNAWTGTQTVVSTESFLLPHWDGSINTLLCRIAEVRDAPSRALLYDAVMALLRAARATVAGTTSPTTTADTDHWLMDAVRDDETDEVQGERDSLSTRLHAAAEAQARQLEARRTEQFSRDAVLLQLPREITPLAAASVSGSAGSGGAAAGGVGSAGAVPMPKRRSPSASGGSSRRAGGGGGGASGAASGGGNGSGGADGGLLGHGGAPLVLGSLRAHLKSSTAVGTPAEEEGFCREREELLAAHERTTVAEHPSLVRLCWHELSSAVEAGSTLSLVDSVQRHRLGEMRQIQRHVRMTVDASAVVMPVKAVSHTGSGRKR